MEENVQQNRYIAYIKKNRYVLFGLVLLVILIAITSLMITFIVKTPRTNETTTPTTSPELTVTAVPTIIETDEVKVQARPQIDPLVDVPYEIPKVRRFENGWAVIQITNPTTDPANVIMKNENGSWKVMLGPGTFFEESDLQAIGAPQDVSQAANSGL